MNNDRFKNIDPVEMALATKAMFKAKKSIKEIAKVNPELAYQTKTTINMMCKMFGDVLAYHPAVHVAILVLANGIKDVSAEYDKLKSKNVIQL